MLAKSVTQAARFIAERGVVEEGGPILVRFITQVASRFGVVVTQKAAAQAVPVIGALGGAAVNYAFIEHFQDMREPSAERHAKRAAANSFEEGGRRGSLPSRSDEIGASHNVQNTGDLLRLLDVDAHDLSVRPVGAEKMSRDLVTELVIGGVTAQARDQSQVFPAASKLMFGQFPSQRLTDSSTRTARAPRVGA